MINLRDQPFGLLVAEEPTTKRQFGNVVWRCRCACGNVVEVNVNRLRVGAVKSCGCLNHQPIGGKQRARCVATECERFAKGHGLCIKHLERMRRHGSTELPAREKVLCSVEGCERPSRSKGLCNMHRIRVKFHGTPGEAAPRKGAGGTGSVNKRTGYRYFYRPKHPNASKNGLVAEHVMVMGEMLGRPLRKGESVHHHNGMRSDNRPENLELRTGIHPAGQSVEEMTDFCKRYLAEYGHLQA